MRTAPRTRHYLSPGALTLCRPVLSFDYAREAYILRGVGDRLGPVVREDRRRRAANGYKGPERRGVVGSGQSRRRTASAGSAGSASGGTATRSKTAAQTRSGATGQTRTGGGGQTRSGTGGQTRAKANRRSRPKNPRG